MIAISTLVAIVLAIGYLVLNWFAFRADAAAAGHGLKQMLRMAAIWLGIIVGLALAFSLVTGLQ